MAKTGKMLTSQRLQISSLASILPGRPEKVARTALQKVRALGVDVRLSTRVSKPTKVGDGRTELTLDGPGTETGGDGDGTKPMVVDLHIPAYGETPNSSYMPSEFLDEAGHIRTGEYLDLPGADGVYALGDVTNVDPAQFVYMDVQTKHMAKNLLLALASRPLKPYKPATWGKFGNQPVIPCRIPISALLLTMFLCRPSPIRPADWP